MEPNRLALAAACGAVVMLLATACDRATPTPLPTLLPTQTPLPGSSTVKVRAQGIAIDLDTEQPVPNAVVTLIGVRIRADLEPAQSASTTTDGDGRFTLDLTLPSNFYNVRFELTRSGYEESYAESKLLSGEDVVIRGTSTLTIRPGESLELRVPTGAAACGAGRAWCRRINVESAGSADVTLELTDYDSEWTNGLVLLQSQPENAPYGYTTVLSVPPGPAWVIGVGKVRLTAR